MGKKRRREHDRLSPLPDATLIRILSYLATDVAARTSVLSRRWRRLYAAVPVVDLVDPKVGLTPRNNRFDNKPICFEHKVTCALLGRDPTVPIRALRLDAFNITTTLFDQCVVMALASGAEELDVKLRCHESSRIRLCPFGPYVESSADFDEGDQGRYTRTHPHIFRSATLRRLSLARWRLEFPGDVSLMALETLVLSRIMAPGEELQRLISSCPRLLSLTLEECPSVKKLTITNACLQSFAMVCCHKSRRIVLESRRVCSLRYKGGIPRRRSFLSVANHGALANLTIDICQAIDDTTQGDLAPITELIGMCTNLTFLHLALRPAMVCYCNLFASVLCRLPCLRQLELKGCLRSDHSVRSVAALLQSTPNLEALTLFPLLPDPRKTTVCYFFFRDLDDELREDYDDKEADYSGQVQVPEGLWTTQTCFKQSLRRISFVGYRGRPFQRVLAKFLLSKVEALEELSVSIVPGCSAYRDEIARELASWRFNRHTRVICV